MTNDPLGIPPNSALEPLGDMTAISRVVFALLQETPLFADVTQNEFDTLVGFMRGYEAKREGLLFREGDPGSYMMIVVEGAIRIVRQLSTHDRLTLDTVARGGMLGEMALVDGRPRSASCEVDGHSVLLAFTRAGFQALGIAYPQIALKIMAGLAHALSERLRSTTDRLVAARGH